MPVYIVPHTDRQSALNAALNHSRGSSTNSKGDLDKLGLHPKEMRKCLRMHIKGRDLKPATNRLAVSVKKDKTSLEAEEPSDNGQKDEASGTWSSPDMESGGDNRQPRGSLALAEFINPDSSARKS